jgi:lipid II:glycine glycyltransferase (peptidoglycan interpeptide bridge formation enzyme)
MEVKKIQDKKTWEDFLLGQKEKTFLQSWNWGEFQEKMGNKIWRLGIFENEKLAGIALISKITAKRGTFLLIQHGPNISSEVKTQKSKILEILLKELGRIGKENGASFIRMNPLWKQNQENQDILKHSGFREAPMHANAYEATWKLELAPSEEELLMQMRKTTRYLIRQTLKNQDITAEKSNSPADAKIYQKLYAEVAKRQHFTPFSPEYVKNEFEIFSKDGQALWFFGKYKGEVAAAALVIFWSGIGFYHQAASGTKYSKLSIPYLLCWEAIKEAKKRECVLFDFWGFTDPKKYPKHPWAGPTLFKMGFGGQLFEYLKTQDYPLSKKYWLTFLFEKLRKSKRGL